MNIAFEAKRVFNNGTGLGHYSRTLVTSLANGFPEHEYYLFTPSTSAMFSTNAFANMHTVTPSQWLHQRFKSAWRSSWVKTDLRKYKIHLYHGLSHEIPLGIHNTSIKSVVTMHDIIHERYPEQYNPIDVRIYRRKFKYACKHANRVIAISEQTKNDLITWYKVPEEKIAVCYQSCNPAFSNTITTNDKLRIQQKYQLPPQFYLYVGSIIERKNLLTICKALTQIKNNIPLVVIGKGDGYEKKVQQFVQEHQLTQRVIFLSHTAAAKDIDFVTAKDFPAIYKQALCMIYPSIFEGFGIPVLEALTAGIPVITSNISCLPEAGGDAAIYVNPFEVSDMVQAMEAVANNATLRTEAITKGYLHAQKFTPHACAAEVMKVYQQTMCSY
ncbi:MAG: glycosyltransferase family 4 protein [Chitinophagaceae bacterium]